jgi:peptidoglycan/LPS O-acetylase OafA/YrhL
MKQTHATTYRPFYIPCLDGIRAVAFGLVFAAHSGLYWIPSGLGVSIFFFLSGYLITTILRIEYEKYGKIDIRRFYLRRVFRIFPPLYITYVLILVLQTGFGLAPTEEINIKAVLFQLFHLTNYHQVLYGESGFPVGTSVLWSLAVEQHFYLIYPIFFALIYGRMNRTQTSMLFLGICLAILLWRFFLIYGFDAGQSRIFSATDTRIDSILYGCLLAACWNPLKDSFKSKRAITNGFLVTSSACLLLLCSSLTLLQSRLRQALGFSLQGIAMIPLFFYLIKNNEAIIVKWLENRLIRFLGVISYTLYLVHFSIILILRDTLKTNLLFISILAFVASLIWAISMYYLVEKPVARLRKRNRKITADTQQYSPSFEREFCTVGT